MGQWHSLLYDFGAHLLEEINTQTTNGGQKLDFDWDQPPWSLPQIFARTSTLVIRHESFPCISVLFSFQLST